MSLDLRDLADAALDVCTDDPEEFSQGELSFPESQEYQPFYSRTHSPFTQTPLIVSDLSQTPLALPLPAIMTPMGLTSFFCAPLLHFLFFFPDLNLAMLPEPPRNPRIATPQPSMFSPYQSPTPPRKRSRPKIRPQPTTNAKLVGPEFSYKYRFWCITCWDLGKMLDSPATWGFLGYPVSGAFQLEKGHISGSKHYQGYFEFKDGATYNELRKVFKDSVHNSDGEAGIFVAPRWGTHEAALDYVRKDDTCVFFDGAPTKRVCWGEFNHTPAGAARAPSSPTIGPIIGAQDHTMHEGKMFQRVRDMILEGKSADFIGMHDPAAGLSIGKQKLEWLCDLQHPARSTAPEVIIVVGPPATGKSEYVRRMWGGGENEEDKVFTLSLPSTADDKVWWDGFNGQGTVVLDEFCGQIDIKAMNQLLDKYPYRVGVKGLTKRFTATRIVITSNNDPTTWWPKATALEFDTFRRRVTFAYDLWVHAPNGNVEWVREPKWEKPKGQNAFIQYRIDTARMAGKLIVDKVDEPSK